EGLAKLVSFLQGIAPLDQIACILETTHGLLITALLEAGAALYPVNPKTVDRKRKASGAKTDLIDAYLLAKHGRSEFADLRRLSPDGPQIAELKALTRDQDALISPADAPGQSTGRLPQSLLSRGLDLVYQASAKVDPALFANLSHP